MCSHDRQHIFSLNIYYPQTSSEISLTRSIFAHCSASVSLLPISQEAKPHRGLRLSRSRGIYLAAYPDAGDDRSLIFQYRRFGGYQTQHHLLAISHILQRLETTRTLISHTPDRRYLHLHERRDKEPRHRRHPWWHSRNDNCHGIRGC